MSRCWETGNRCAEGRREGARRLRRCGIHGQICKPKMACLFREMVAGGRSEHFVGATISPPPQKFYSKSGFTQKHGESLLPSLNVIDTDVSHATSQHPPITPVITT
jgi:hypothetical protein